MVDVLAQFYKKIKFDFGLNTPQIMICKSYDKM